MPLIGTVGRRSGKVRLLNLAIHVVLIAGCVTMIYPFLVMLAGSVKCNVDFKTMRVIPEYFWQREMLYRKFVSARHNDSLESCQTRYEEAAAAFEFIQPPAELNAVLVDDWRAFLDELDRQAVGGVHPSGLDHRVWQISESRCPGGVGRNLRVFRDFVKGRFDGDLSDANRALGTAFSSWEEITLHEVGGAAEHEHEQFFRLILEFKHSLPRWLRLYYNADGAFIRHLQLQYNRLEELNREFGVHFGAWEEIRLPARMPPGRFGTEWLAFVRSTLPAYHLRDDPLTTPPEELRVVTLGGVWREFLRERYGGDLVALNRAHARQYAAFDAVGLPLKQADYADFLDHERNIFWEFFTRNYRVVLNTLLVDGRAMINTMIYCFLAIGAALIVNPMAAYALSRYKPPTTYKILLFLMLTMAFPPMVLGIPTFLLMKKLGMLNTFAALVLPGLASGFSIFLLKGFFDSLPRELYECASLDGASEWVMFWHITMALSKPILAVIALGAFTAAYGNFMFAFIVCQDPSMWTVMVNLYQLQMRSPQAVQFAALVVAAIPTFLVFVFCQKIILRGIIVPTEK